MKTYTAGPCDTCGYTSGPSKTPGLAAHGQRIHSCTKQVAKTERAVRGAAKRAAVDRTPKPCNHKQANHVHGTHACYVLDRCRCTPCATSNTTYERTRSRRHAYGRFDTYTDAQPVRDHITHLMTAGLGLKRIAELGGVSNATLGKILYGTANRAPTRRVTRDVATKVLAVTATPAALAGGAKVPGTGTTRRLQALMTLGWSQTQLANRLGLTMRNLAPLLHGRRGTTAATARAVTDLYDELWDTTPPALGRFARASVTRSRSYALQHGFAKPMAWDDDTIDDPTATPDTGQTSSGATVENVEWLLTEVDAIATVAQVAHRLGISVSGVQYALARDGRRDLLDQLVRNAELAGRPTNKRRVA